MRDTAISLKFPPDFSVDFPWFLSENLQGVPWKSATDLSPMNPPKILINSAGNLREIPKESTWKIPLNFHMDYCFTYNPSFPVDSPPPFIRHHGDSSQNPRDFVRWSQSRTVSPLFQFQLFCRIQCYITIKNCNIEYLHSHWAWQTKHHAHKFKCLCVMVLM